MTDFDDAWLRREICAFASASVSPSTPPAALGGLV
jgi:hypothetical protein